MSAERRDGHREAVDEFVAIIDNAGAIFTRCKMTDVSETGAQLQIAQTCDVPDRFTLLLLQGSVRRSCEVAWRRDDLLGVTFVPSRIREN
jgi:hypothetical protein